MVFTLALAWLCNFTVFFRLQKWTASVAIIVPWIFLLSWTIPPVQEEVSFKTLSIIPFYPWAIGIGMIHLSKLREHKSATV
jgi:hypothetical protein